MACITHTAMSCELGCTIDLVRVASCSRDVVYKKVPFDVLTWHHKKIRCTCLLYRTGKMICHGNKSQLRQYARILQKLGYPVHLSKVKLITQSAVYQLKNIVNYLEMAKFSGAVYEPEICHALGIRQNGLYFIVYKSGKVVITGIKNQKMINDIVNPTLLEIEIL